MFFNDNLIKTTDSSGLYVIVNEFQNQAYNTNISFTFALRDSTDEVCYIHWRVKDAAGNISKNSGYKQIRVIDKTIPALIEQEADNNNIEITQNTNIYLLSDIDVPKIDDYVNTTGEIQYKFESLSTHQDITRKAMFSHDQSDYDYVLEGDIISGGIITNTYVKLTYGDASGEQIRITWSYTDPGNNTATDVYTYFTLFDKKAPEISLTTNSYTTWIEDGVTSVTINSVEVPTIVPKSISSVSLV